MKLWSIRAWRNLKFKSLLPPQGDKTREGFSHSNKALTGSELEPSFLDSKVSVAVITSEWPNLVMSLQKDNRPGFVINKSEPWDIDTRQQALHGNRQEGSMGTSWVAVFSYRSFQNSSGIQKGKPPVWASDYICFSGNRPSFTYFQRNLGDQKQSKKGIDVVLQSLENSVSKIC